MSGKGVYSKWLDQSLLVVIIIYTWISTWISIPEHARRVCNRTLMVPTCAPQGIPLAIHERISSRISPKILIGVFNSFISILQRFLQDIALMVPLALFKTFPYEYLQEFAQDSSRYTICEFCRQISRKCFLLHLLLSFSISYDTYPRTWVS